MWYHTLYYSYISTKNTVTNTFYQRSCCDLKWSFAMKCNQQSRVTETLAFPWQRKAKHVYHCAITRKGKLVQLLNKPIVRGKLSIFFCNLCQVYHSLWFLSTLLDCLQVKFRKRLGIDGCLFGNVSTLRQIPQLSWGICLQSSEG